MDEAKVGKLVHSQEEGSPDSAAPQTVPPDVAMEMLNRKSFAGAEKFSLAVERFSILSSEMITLLMGLSQEINKSAEELNEVRSAVELKKRELATLSETVRMAEELARQTKELKRQQADLEARIADERRVWEMEKAERAREEEEHRQSLSAEHFRAQQELEEELRTIRQRNQEAQEEAEKEFAEREMLLKNKEVEWSQLINELDQFLSKLAQRTNPHSATPAVVLRGDAGLRPGSPVSSVPLSGYFHEDNDWSGEKDASGLDPETALMWENVWGDKLLALDNRNHGLGQDSVDEMRSSQSFLKDFPALQSREIEDTSPEHLAKRDTSPLKFAPKKSNNHV